MGKHCVSSLLLLYLYLQGIGFVLPTKRRHALMQLTFYKHFEYMLMSNDPRYQIVCYANMFYFFLFPTSVFHSCYVEKETLYIIWQDRPFVRTFIPHSYSNSSPPFFSSTLGWGVICLDIERKSTKNPSYLI